MELGGNAPFIVFDDAILEDALDGAMIAKMRHGGETCTAANRFYVQAGIFDRFAEGLTARMQRVQLGEGSSPATTCGPLVNKAGLAKVQELVADAMTRGARVLTGGHGLERRGFFYQPTVLVDVPLDAQIVNEEISARLRC